MLLVIFALASCQSQSAKGYDINKVRNAPNGWLANSIYQISFFSSWDRERFYPLGGARVIGKTAKSPFDLRKEAKAAILSQLKIQFNQKLRSLIRDQINEDISDLIIDEAINQVIGKKTIHSKIVEEAYSIDHDAYLLIQFSNPDLNMLVSDSVTVAKNILAEEEQARLEAESPPSPESVPQLPTTITDQTNQLQVESQVVGETNSVASTPTNQ